MTSIRRSDVPLYLRAGEFYQGLDPHDEDVFAVPDRCFKNDTKVQSVEDLKSLLDSIRFWGVTDVPVEVFQFLLSESIPYAEELVAQYPQFAAFLRSCVEVRDTTTVLSIASAIKLKLGVGAVRILHQRGDFLTAAATEAAASVGDLATLQYLHSVSCPWDERVVAAFLASGDLRGLAFALENGCPLPGELMNKAAITGNIDVLKCLRDHDIPWEANTLNEAVRSKNVECVRYVYGQGCVIGAHDCATAAYLGSVECLAFVHQNGGAFNNVMLNACMAGSLACIQYLHAQLGFVAADAACVGLLAHGGHLECLRFVHENGCPWDATTAYNAVRSDEVNCLEYAHNHGCAMPTDLAQKADLSNAVKCMFYIQESSNSPLSDY